MAGFSVQQNEHLIRSQLWSTELKEVLQETLMGLRYVDWETQLPDGDILNIPSIGQAEVRDYDENQAILYTALDTGNFQFSINKYKSAATYITQKMRQDSYYAARLEAMFVPKHRYALEKSMEVDLLATGPDAQTASGLNAINTGNHRFVASGTGEVLSIIDFARARYALQKANVPMRNLVAIVDPSVEYALSTQTNLMNLAQTTPMWENVVREGITTGTQFRFNIYGFDIYVSQNLKQGIAETIDGRSVTSGVANLFFSADASVLPIKGLIRQQPMVWSEFNKDLQREEYVMTCRYGFKLYRPENLVVILTDTDQIYT